MLMPRQKSEITSQATLTIRLTHKQKEFVKDMGGSQWIRNYIERQIRNEEIQLGLSPQNSSPNNLKK
jgi:hypothetical protein